MKSKILSIIENKPKHYTRIIAADADLDTWVKTNSNSVSEHYPTQVYCAVNNCDSVCRHGNERTVSRYSEGLKNCGPAAKCQCTKEDISKNVSISKLNYTTERSTAIQSKREATMIQRFGYAYNGQRPEVKANLSKPKIPDSAFSKLTDFNWINEEYNIKCRTASDIANELGIYYSTVIEYCKKFDFVIRQVTNYSKEEKEIVEYIRQFGFEVETNVWNIIPNKELDIYIPALKLAIELNGVYWHSFHPDNIKNEDKNRHLDKTIACELQGIALLHITDIEWNTKQEIIKSILKSKLKLNKRVYARKCTVQQITDNTVMKQFLIQYHIQGYVPAAYNLGLYLEDELVMVLTLGKSRFDKSYEYEILRIAAKTGITVTAGISKLMSYVRQVLLIKTPIVSYCDRAKSNGNGYLSSNFTLLKTTEPGYFWTDTKDVLSRFSVRRPKLEKLLKVYDATMTVDANMFANKYRKYWDCGNFVFVHN